MKNKTYKPLLKTKSLALILAVLTIISIAFMAGYIRKSSVVKNHPKTEPSIEKVSQPDVDFEVVALKNGKKLYKNIAQHFSFKMPNTVEIVRSQNSGGDDCRVPNYFEGCLYNWPDKTFSFKASNKYLVPKLSLIIKREDQNAKSMANYFFARDEDLYNLSPVSTMTIGGNIFLSYGRNDQMGDIKQIFFDLPNKRRLLVITFSPSDPVGSNLVNTILYSLSLY